MQLSSAPITAASLAEAKLDQTQKRLSFLWEAAHAPGIAQLAPAVSATLLRSLRCVAFQEDIALAPSHTQIAFCSQCCTVRVAGINTTARVEASAARRKTERNKRRRKESKKAKRQQANQQEATTNSSSSMDLTDSPTDPSDSDHSLVTPQKKRKRASLAQTDSAATTTPRAQSASTAVGFVSPFAGRAALPASASSVASLSATAATSAASGVSSHCLVLHCLRCGHRDRIAGQSRKQKQLLQAAPNDLESLVAQTEQGQSLIASEAAARDQLAKRQKTLQSLQVQQQQPSMIAQPKLRTAMPSLEELALTQQRLQQARAATAAGSFFGEQVRDAAAPTQRPAATAVAAPVPSPSPSAAPSASAAPFSFSRSGASSAAPSSGKKPSLSSVLAAAAPSSSSSVFSSASMFAAGNSSSMHGICIAGGIQSVAAAGASKGFTFTKSGAGAGAQKKR